MMMQFIMKKYTVIVAPTSNTEGSYGKVCVAVEKSTTDKDIPQDQWVRYAIKRLTKPPCVTGPAAEPMRELSILQRLKVRRWATAPLKPPHYCPTTTPMS